MSIEKIKLNPEQIKAIREQREMIQEMEQDTFRRAGIPGSLLRPALMPNREKMEQPIKPQLPKGGA